MSSTIIIAMIVCNLSAGIWYAVVVPFLPREFKDLGIPEHLYGYIFATYSVSAMIWSFVCGKLLTKYGRRRIIFFRSHCCRNYCSSFWIYYLYKAISTTYCCLFWITCTWRNIIKHCLNNMLLNCRYCIQGQSI